MAYSDGPQWSGVPAAVAALPQHYYSFAAAVQSEVDSSLVEEGDILAVDTLVADILVVDTLVVDTLVVDTLVVDILAVEDSLDHMEEVL